MQDLSTSVRICYLWSRKIYLMNLKEKLSQRIGLDDILEITFHAQGNKAVKQELYALLSDVNNTIAWQAAWAFTHFSLAENKWLYAKQDELIDAVLTCQHEGIRRLLLTLLYRQPLTNPPRIDFLEFCLKHALSKDEPPGVKSLCLKLAYELCLLIPELLEEFRLHLDIMPETEVPSIRCVRKNLLKAMKTKKSLQLY